METTLAGAVQGRTSTPAASLPARRLLPVLLGLAGMAASGAWFGCAPRPGPVAVRARNAAADMAPVRRAAAELSEPLDVRAAIDYALTHNLDTAVARQEELIELEARTGARRRMLPSLLASSEESWRSEKDASKSVTFFNNRKSAEPSYSEHQRKSTFNLKLAWNLLDFGIAYFRSRQAQQRLEIAAVRLARARQDLVLRVTEAYWDVQVSRRAVTLAEAVLDKIEAQRAMVRKQIQEEAINKIEGLQTEIALIENQTRLRRYRQKLHADRARLAALLGLPAGSAFRLAHEDLALAPARVSESRAIDFAPLEAEALCSRPELFEQDFQETSSQEEARIALASLFPNAALFGQFDRNTDDLLYHHNWYTVGLNASLDLLSLPEKLSRRRRARLQAELSRKRRTGLAIAIIAQVHLAGIDLADAAAEYQLARALTEKRGELREAFRQEQEAGAVELTEAERARQIPSREVLSADAQLLEARIRMLELAARFRIARARLRNSLGRGRDGEPGVAAPAPRGGADSRPADADRFREGAPAVPTGRDEALDEADALPLAAPAAPITAPAAPAGSVPAPGGALQAVPKARPEEFPLAPGDQPHADVLGGNG